MAQMQVMPHPGTQVMPHSGTLGSNAMMNATNGNNMTPAPLQPMLQNAQSGPVALQNNQLAKSQSGQLAKSQSGLPQGDQAHLKFLRRAQKSMAAVESRNKTDIKVRLGRAWKNDEVLDDIDNKLNYYIARHGKHRLVGDSGKSAAGGNKSKELQILEKMKREEEAGRDALSVEKAAQKALRSGLREYIDYAVDEVERYAHISKTGAVTADFDWSCCGDHHDVPALRRSQGANRVDPGLELPPICTAQAGLGSDEMFEMDFLRDFAVKSKRQTGECELLGAREQQKLMEQLRFAAHKAKAPALFRADNKAPLFEQGRDSTPDLIGPPPQPGKFGDRQWSALYSLV